MTIYITARLAYIQYTSAYDIYLRSILITSSLLSKNPCKSKALCGIWQHCDILHRKVFSHPSNTQAARPPLFLCPRLPVQHMPHRPLIINSINLLYCKMQYQMDVYVQFWSVIKGIILPH